jgi:hypothetical protein
MRWFPSDRTNGRVDVCCLYRWGPCRPDPGSRHHTPRKLRGAERPDLSIEEINQRNVCFGSTAVQKTRPPGPVSGLKRPFSSVGTGPPIPHDSRGFHPPLFSLCPFMLRKKGRSFGPSRAIASVRYGPAPASGNYSWMCASRNHRALSRPRETSVKTSAVSASPASADWSMASRTLLAAWP